MVPHTRHNVGALLLSPPDFGHLLLSKKEIKLCCIYAPYVIKNIQKCFLMFMQLTVTQMLAISISLKYSVFAGKYDNQ